MCTVITNLFDFFSVIGEESKFRFVECCGVLHESKAYFLGRIEMELEVLCFPILEWDFQSGIDESFANSRQTYVWKVFSKFPERHVNHSILVFFDILACSNKSN